jgi:putative ABC transport system permease protein
MISPRWRKVFRDLWLNKTRTILVVLSVAVGVFALGMVAGTNQILFRELGQTWLAASPSSATLFTQPFDDTLVEAVRKIPGVGWAEGRRIVNVRVQVNGEWKDVQLTAIKDFKDIRLNRFTPETGDYPPKDRELLVERASLDWVGARPGDILTIELPSKKLRQMRLAGTVHDLTQPLTSFTGRGSAYVSFDTLDWLGEPRDFDRLDFVVADRPLDEAHIKDVLNLVTDKVERSGREVFFTQVPPPGEHPATPYVRPMILLLGVLGLLAMFLSGFLVINTISAVLKQQTRQIGVMKAIGGGQRAITIMYLVMGGFFGAMALVIGIPLGALGARAFSQFMASFINFDIVNFSIPPSVFVLQVVIGLVVPFLAALYPVIRGTRLTVHEAITDIGIADSRSRIADSKRRSANATPSRTQSAIGNPQSSLLSRPHLIALRNAFRQRGRVVLTLITLVLAGAMFIAVLSLRASLDRSFDEAFKVENYDVEVSFDRSYRIDRIREEAMAVPGVVTAETWGAAVGRRKRADGTYGDNIRLAAPPVGTAMIDPQLVEGRWLLPEDQNALVANTQVLQNEKDLRVGDTVTMRIGGRESDWKIVGLMRGLFASPTVYANYDYFSRAIRDADRAGSVRVQTRLHSASFQNDVARALEGHYDGIGMKVSSISSLADVRARSATGARILVVFMVIMALLLAFVGGLGLMGTLSLNTLERTREIGVMRAVGARNGTVRSIVIVEGIVIGLASWAVAALISYPFGKILSDAVGKAFGGVALSYSYSMTGLVTWLIAIVVLSLVASLLPAWNASRLTVREVLAYE